MAMAMAECDELFSESASVTLRSADKGSHDLVVKNYSSHKAIGVDEAIESDEFTAGGHRWMIRLFPHGRTKVDVYNPDYASLFISLIHVNNNVEKSNSSNSSSSSSDDSDIGVQFLYDLYIVDQSGKGNHYRGPLSHETWKATIHLTRGNMCGHFNFIKRTTLESRGYMKDDCLKVHCDVGVLTCRIRNLPVVGVPESKIGADLGKLLESKKGADVLFSVGDVRFWGHKWILAARSRVFRARLSGCQQQQVQEIDMEPSVFKAMLWFIYTGSLKEEEEEAVSDSSPFMLKSFMAKMLAAADQFELKKLKKICESRILEKLSGESVAYLLHLADLYHAMELRAACLRYAAENQDAILESDGCEYLKETCPSLFLELAYKEHPSSSGGGELEFCSRVLSALKEPLVGMLNSRDASDVAGKLKEA